MNDRTRWDRPKRKNQTQIRMNQRENATECLDCGGGGEFRKNKNFSGENNFEHYEPQRRWNLFSLSAINT